jgi:amino acid transporter
MEIGNSHTYLNDMSQYKSDMIRSFTIFYLLIIVGYVAPGVLNLFHIKHIEKSHWIQLILSFMLFFYLVTLVTTSNEIKNMVPIEKLVYSIVYFIIFVLLMRFNIYIFAIIISLVFISYFIEINKHFFFTKHKTGIVEINKHNGNDNEREYWISFDIPFKIRLCPVYESQYDTIVIVGNLLYYFVAFLYMIGFIEYIGKVTEVFKLNPHETFAEILLNDKHLYNVNVKDQFWFFVQKGLFLR